MAIILYKTLSTFNKYFEQMLGDGPVVVAAAALTLGLLAAGWICGAGSAWGV